MQSSLRLLSRREWLDQRNCTQLFDQTFDLFNSQIDVEVEKGVVFARQRLTIDASVFFSLKSETFITDQIHRPVRSPVGANFGGWEIRYICFLIEVQPFRFAISVQFGPGVAFSRAKWESALGQTNVQVEASIISGALKREALGLVFDSKRNATGPTSEINTFVL